MSKPEIKLVRTVGNWFVVSPTTPVIKTILTNRFTFVTRNFLQGKERRDARKMKLTLVRDEFRECFDYDTRDRIVLSLGFLYSAFKLLKDEGYPVSYVDRGVTEREIDVFKPRFDLAFDDVDLRHRQSEFLVKMASHETGRFDCPPGYGKSYMIGLFCRLYPKARIGVIAKRVSVLRDMLYRDICGMVPNVGIIGGGMRVPGRRVMCYTFDSLHHAVNERFDAIVCDEVHEAAADDASGRIAAVIATQRTRMFGLSGSQDMRLDGKDYRCEALFGQILMKIAYGEAVDNRMVVPIEVRCRRVLMDEDPCEGCRDDDRERRGIWQNEVRNRLIAADALSYADDVQVMVSVKTVEHLFHLRKFLPNFTPVYAETAMERENWNGKTLRERLTDKGLVTDADEQMTTDRRTELTSKAERGELRKFIVTGVFNVGVNLKHLGVLIRADGSGSPIMDTQLPGRVSRINEDGKEVGIVHDYYDEFNIGFSRKSKSRFKTYRSHNWSIVSLRNTGELAQQTLWEE